MTAETKIELPDFKLHSSGPNWWHFRHNPNSRCQSFTITMTVDGTTILTGDYGVLAVCRYNDDDIGFPNDDTDIEYFSSKITQEFEKKEFDAELAKHQINDYFEDELKNGFRDSVPELGDFETREEMLKQLYDIEDSDWWDFSFGMKYRYDIIWKFALLKFWTRYLKSMEETK